MNSSIWLWFAGTLCMQIVPWTISGIKGLVENIPQQLPEAAPRRQDVARYLRDLFQNQVAILCIVPAGIAMMQQQRAYGRDDFRAMVEAKTQRFASVRPAHRPVKSGATIG